MAHSKPLGRNEPPDREHELKHPIKGSVAETLTNTAVVAGTVWYTNFDNPVLGTDGRYRIGKGPLGSIRGGHCYCHEPAGEPDHEVAHIFYDQANEGACEGFGNSRALTLLHGGILYDAFWLYDDARRIEGTYPDGEGSTNRAAGQALVKWGDHPAAADGNTGAVIQREPWHKGIPSTAIAAFKWAETVEEILKALGFPPSTLEIPILNSWGKDGYPHRVYMPVELIPKLKRQEGEYSVLVAG